MSTIRGVGLVLLAVVLAGHCVTVAAQASNELGGPDANVDCGSFLLASDGGQRHAQAVYDSDRSDPYGLDGPQGPDNDTRGEPDVACETEADLGTEDRATCQSFREQRHADALLEATGRSDPYNLDPDGNRVACDGGQRGEGENLDGVPAVDDEPEPLTDSECTIVVQAGRAFVSSGCGTTDVFVSAAPSAPGDSLEEILEARFASLEEDFTAFEARAEDGFGMFPDDKENVATAAQPNIVSASRHPVTLPRWASVLDAGNDTASPRKAGNANVDKPQASSKQKAKRDKRNDDKERKSKRDRRKGKRNPR